MITTDQLRHGQVDMDGLGVHVVEAGASSGTDFLLLHGWPENWSLYECLLPILGVETRAVAIDLPGVGESNPPPSTGNKRWLAARLPGLIRVLGLKNVTLVGHDIGGQIAYAALRVCPEAAARVVLMNIVIPGIDPWQEVVRNPHLWHFAFHAVPQLPETLVFGHIADYFDFFYDALAGPRGVSADERARFVAAYSQPTALQTGFGWYRAYRKDEEENRRDHGQPVRTPVLCLRGDRETGAITDYVEGLRHAGCVHVVHAVIPDCGHFAPLEQPNRVAAALLRFAQAHDRASPGERVR